MIERRSQDLSLIDALARRYGRMPHEIGDLTAEQFTFAYVCARAGDAATEDINGGDG